MKDYLDTPEGMEKRDAGKDSLTVAHIKAKNKHDPDAAELTLDDFFLEPITRDLPDGKFVDGGDLWTEDGWWEQNKFAFQRWKRHNMGVGVDIKCFWVRK